MKVTVVFEDGVILVDRQARSGFTLINADPNWRVIQWQDDHGWIEVHKGDRVWITDFSFVQPYVDLWNSKPSE